MPEKILVVDDDADSLKLISLMLKRQGYDVLSAGVGQAGLQIAYQERPDLIILDVMMPDMDGYEVCRRLRAEPTTAKIPIIMFTAKTLVDDKVAGFEAGADDYLTKPTHPAELASRVRAVIQRSQASRDGAGMASSAPKNELIGFLGVKGGVGTTTLASSVGALLAKHYKTILADLRPGQGSLGVSLGFTRAQNLATVLSADINTGVVERNLIEHPSGLRVLLSSTNPQETQMNITPEAVSHLAAGCKAVARYSLFDLGAGLNRLNVRLIRESNHTVLLMEPNNVAVSMAAHILREIAELGIQPHKIALVIFNRAQTNVQLPWQDVERLLGREVAAIISPAPELAFQAQEAGLPLTYFQPSSIVSGQIAKLVEELVKGG